MDPNADQPPGDTPASEAPPPEAGPELERAVDDESRSFEAQAVASFLARRETSALREARDRARAKRHKAVEEEAIASWIRARKTS